MKALSIRQPWAALIESGSKTIEVRSWSTCHRGDLLILASAKKHLDLPVGVSICIARLVDCRPMTSEDEPAARCESFAGAFAWVLDDIRPVVHVPFKGRRGLFDVSDVPSVRVGIEPPSSVWIDRRSTN